MKTVSYSSLKYFAAVLSQMAVTLKAFDMPITADLLEKAKSDIEHKLHHDADSGGNQKPR